MSGKSFNLNSLSIKSSSQKKRPTNARNIFSVAATKPKTVNIIKRTLDDRGITVNKN